MLSQRLPVRLLVVAGCLIGMAAVFACGTDPVAVDACRQIEYARCENANTCGIDLSVPTHPGDSPNLDVGACKRFYDDQCLHGMNISSDPGATKTQACVDAINDPNSGCDIVKAPENSAACSFLNPNADASTE